MRGYFLPSDVQLSVTRNYGETAAQKSNELLWHMLLAVLSVTALVWLALGFRESAVVLTAIPVTLALTLFVFYFYGYTLNRITLFALIFSIGILVDDAIVVVENIVRHARMDPEGRSLEAVAIRAVDEVGNPTILATLAVVAAILPMAFVGGLMGPYMRPIPIGATAAMLFSLVVAFVVTPWAAVRLLGRHGGTHPEGDDRLTRLYRRVMQPLIETPRTRAAFLALVAVLLLAAVALVPLGVVTVKMLPFDNKSELQVVVRMPEGTPLETTARVAATLADEALRDTDVTERTDVHGVPAPYTFNGLVRHYFLRREPNQADLLVMLDGKDERSDQSHAIAKRIRRALDPMARRERGRHSGGRGTARPAGSPDAGGRGVRPDPARRLELARQVRTTMERTSGVVDVDWYVDADRSAWRLDVDSEKAAAAGLRAADVSAVVRMAGAGMPAGVLHDPAVARGDPHRAASAARRPRVARRRARHQAGRRARQWPSAS